MKKMSIFISLLLLWALPITLVHAEDLIVFPAKGQSVEQTEKDKGTCYTWAKQQTGVDPLALAEPPRCLVSSAPPSRRK